MTSPPTQNPLRNRHRPRNPAVIAAFAVGVGVFLDDQFRWDWTVWLGVAAVTATMWLIGFRQRDARWTVVPLLMALACIGGARHHQFRHAVADDDISRFASPESTLVRITGRIRTAPVIIPKKEGRLQVAWLQADRTFAVLDCESVRNGDEIIPVSGAVRLQVSGHLLHVQPGDRVAVQGWLHSPAGPRNPGQDDFRRRLSRQGMSGIVYVNSPEAVTRSEQPTPFSLRRPLAAVRQRAEELLVRHLRGRALAVGSTILLGDRTHLNEELRDAFIRSGMMHVLAISGLHVGLLAWFLLLMCRVTGLPPRMTTATVLLGVIGYALLTDVRPSVVRATIFITVLLIGRATDRPVSALNALAVAALVILLWNPTDLFDVGAQLSFLSVIGLIASGGWMFGRSSSGSESELTGRLGLAAEWLSKGWLWLKRMYLAMAGVWILTVPLVAARFHIVSPVGLLINTLLMPWVAVVLGFGYLLLIVGLLVPFLASLIAMFFGYSLEAMLSIVDWASALHLGHFSLPGPRLWWLIGYYLLLAAVLFLARDRPRIRHWGWSGVCAWTILGLSLAAMPARQEGLRCTFLSMGHGVGVVVELPNGKTLLYDAGTIGDAERATRIVQAALWDRGRSQLDAVVISHADIDHFNGVPGLLDSLPVGTLFVTRPFLDFKQRLVVAVCDTARERSVPIRILRAGDRLRMDEDVELIVRHPQPGTHYDSDNAASLVLEIRYAGRRILLTGDLEKDGLQQLQRQESQPVDVLLSPHHGSPAANPESLARWANPRYVIISGGRKIPFERMVAAYGPDRRVLSTHRHGAVTVRITPGGDLSVTSFITERDVPR